jgi:hypothetical protein
MCHMPCPSHSSWLDHTNNWCEGYRLQWTQDSPQDITFVLFSYQNVHQPWCLERWASIAITAVCE